MKNKKAQLKKKEKPITQNQIRKSKFYAITHAHWFGILFGTLISLGIASYYYQRESKEFEGLMKRTTDTSIEQITKAVNKATEESKKEITNILQKEITEAAFPNDFSLVIGEEPYSTGKICKIKSKTKEIKLYFAVKNNSKYPAKDTTIYIYLDKDTIKEGMKTMDEYFKANRIKGTLGGFINKNFEAVGFIIPSPIYHGARRYIPPIKLQMIKNETIIIVEINGQHRFFIVYSVTKDDEKTK